MIVDSCFFGSVEVEGGGVEFFFCLALTSGEQEKETD